MLSNCYACVGWLVFSQAAVISPLYCWHSIVTCVCLYLLDIFCGSCTHRFKSLIGSRESEAIISLTIASSPSSFFFPSGTLIRNINPPHSIFHVSSVLLFPIGLLLFYTPRQGLPYALKLNATLSLMLFHVLVLFPKLDRKPLEDSASVFCAIYIPMALGSALDIVSAQ